MLVLTSIATELADQDPTPRRLAVIARKIADAVPKHRVELKWFERGYLNDPDIDEPGDAEYAKQSTGIG
jgi:hypothetical protein